MNALRNGDYDERLEDLEDDLDGAHAGDDFFKPSEVSVCARLARNGAFEILTLLVISFNAIWMGWDTDTNFAAVLSDGRAPYVRELQLSSNALFGCKGRRPGGGSRAMSMLAAAVRAHGGVRRPYSCEAWYRPMAYG